MHEHLRQLTCEHPALKVAWESEPVFDEEGQAP